MNDVIFNDRILSWILGYLDGWKIYSEPESDKLDESDETINDETITDSESIDISPYLESNELNDKANKTITRMECSLAYEEALDQAYIHTNRLNIDDLNLVEARMFIRGVCKWTASNLWNKYNIRVNNEDMEDTYIQSYGGLLYKSALKMLEPFINQRVRNLTSYSENTMDNWII